ncbi:MAG TPA: enoyl-CoA hydratase-related protein [Pseudonocardia sp.]|nr:enoyl-CoA hydratase-related protein [Pseudonocardia sp.]
MSGSDSTTPEYATILLDVDGPVATLTLNRPHRRNALTIEMDEELEDALARIAADRALRAVIITGAGTGFCSGADLDGSVANEVDKASPVYAQRRLRRSSKLVEVIIGLPKPVIAAVNGAAVGAGCNLALACDLVLAADTARFGQMQFKRGLGIEMGASWTLPRLIGLHKAKEFAFWPELIDARRAAELGVVNRIHPADKLLKEARALAAKISENAPIGLGLAKAALNKSHSMSLAEALDNEAQGQGFLWATADAKEGINAFIEKRPPNFTGS